MGALHTEHPETSVPASENQRLHEGKHSGTSSFLPAKFRETNTVGERLIAFIVCHSLAVLGVTISWPG